MGLRATIGKLLGRQSQSKTAVAISQPQVHKKVPYVVIIDDEAQNIKLRYFLIEFYYPIAEIISTRGDMAWSVITKRDPNLLILGGLNPGISSLELLKKLAQRKAEFPIILTTGVKNSQEELDDWFKQESQEIFAFHNKLRVKVLNKPYGFDDFSEAIRASLEPNRIRPALVFPELDMHEGGNAENSNTS